MLKYKKEHLVIFLVHFALSVKIIYVGFICSEVYTARLPSMNDLAMHRL